MQARTDEMSTNDFKVIQTFLKQSSGIILNDNKQYLVKNRLFYLLSDFQLSSFSELAASLQKKSAAEMKLKVAVIDAMSTNETFWFRDDAQFLELKQKILPELCEKKTAAIKVWSAACSSGQEPYSISMCVEDVYRQVRKKQDVKIIGTDISETVLAQAKRAVYSEIAVSRGLDAQSKNRFFLKTQNGFQLNPEISRRVRFQQFNLLKPYSSLGLFDVVFCRNVLIYFTDEVKRDILSRIAKSLEPGGYLFLSSTESMPANMQEFEAVRNGRVRYFKKAY